MNRTIILLVVITLILFGLIISCEAGSTERYAHKRVCTPGGSCKNIPVRVIYLPHGNPGYLAIQPEAGFAPGLALSI